MANENDKSEYEELAGKLSSQLGMFNSLNAEGLNEIKTVKILSQVLLSQEIKRLGEKLGNEHPRVKKMQQQVKENSNLLKELEVEVEISKIEVPNVPTDGALVHGRITDQANRGILGLTVYAENKNENILRDFGNAKTNSSGYYAILLDEEKLQTFQKTKAYLTVGINKGKAVYCENDSLELKCNQQTVVNITLNRNILWPTQKPAPTSEDDVTIDAIEESAKTGGGSHNC